MSIQGYGSIYEQYSDYMSAAGEYLKEYGDYLNKSGSERTAESRPFEPGKEAQRRVSERLELISKRSAESEIFLPFDYLCDSFLIDTREERLALAACFFGAVFPGFADLYPRADGGARTRRLTLADLGKIFFHSSAEMMYNALFGYISMLFDVSAENIDFSEIELVPSKRLINLLLGSEFLYDLPYSETFTISDPLEEIYGRDAELKLVESAVSSEREGVILIHGERGSGRRFFVKHVCRLCRKNTIFVDMLKLEISDINRVILQLNRELIIQRAFCCITGLEEDKEAAAEKIIRAIIPVTKTVFVCCGNITDINVESALTVRLGELSFSDKMKIWSGSLLPMENADTAEKIGCIYDFSAGKIKRILRECEQKTMLSGGERIAEKLLIKTCGEASDGILEGKAKRIFTDFGLEDLILPEEEKRQLANAISCVKYRNTVYEQWNFKEKFTYGKGLLMLFEGSPGTGKTMAASVLGNELGIPVFKIDISKMMSKYIGETQKNLNEVFDIARKHNAILLFDETDAIFGKRSEIKDSHDKYANAEISFLLQKTEEHSGIIIMTTNFKQNIDDAFMRRITHIIHFPFPDAGCRLELWKNAFPKQAPLDGSEDLNFLAEGFEMTGAMIKSAALGAAFAAAADNRNIEMADIVKSVRGQFAKFGKSLSADDFGPYSGLL